MICPDSGAIAFVAALSARPCAFDSQPLLLQRVPANIFIVGYSTVPTVLALPPSVLLHAEGSDLHELARASVRACEQHEKPPPPPPPRPLFSFRNREPSLLHTSC